MALTAYGKNEALKGATAKMGYVGLFSSAEYAPEATISSKKIKLSGSEGKGFTNGKIVVFRSLTGSVTGLIAGRPYYVVGAATNEFEVALEEGGTGVEVTGHALESASCKIALLTEISGGSYVRVKTSWGSASLGEILDTPASAINVPASTTITDAGWWEKSSGGSGATGLYATAKLENPETYVGAGEYKVTSDKLEANPVA